MDLRNKVLILFVQTNQKWEEAPPFIETSRKRNLLPMLKSKVGLCHVVITTPKFSPEKLTLTVVEMQHLPGIEKTDSKNKFFCLKWTIKNGRRKKCVNINTDTDKLSNVSQRHRKRICVKDNEVVLKLTKRVLQGSTNRQSTRFLCTCSLHRSLWNSGHSDYSEILNILPRDIKGENFARGTEKKQDSR